MRIPMIATLAIPLLYVSCAQVEPKAPQPQSDPTPSRPAVSDVSAMRPANLPKLGPVKPNLKLTAKQRNYLDESIPPDAREILENADRFELLGEIDKDESSEADNRSLVPNRLVAISSEKDKLVVLEAFYSDAAREDSPAVCYEPHHAIRAEFEGKTVEIEICFSCSRFVVKHDSNKYSGTIVREGRMSEGLFETFFRRANN